MGHAVHYIEGIGPHYARLLGAAGITTTEHLLQAGATRRGRMELSRKTGISGKLLFKWVNMCDLLRVRGVAGQYAELLEAAGVGKLHDLCGCNADSLAAALSAANSRRQLVRTLPNNKRVNGWIEHARTLRAVVIPEPASQQKTREPGHETNGLAAGSRGSRTGWYKRGLG